MFHAENTHIPAADPALNKTRMKRSHAQPVIPNDLLPAPWLIVRARAKKELFLRNQLLQREFDAWLPEVKRFRIRAGHKEQFMAALIPGYVFVRHLCDQCPDLGFIPGSTGLLMHDGSPALLRHDDALRLHRLCALKAAPELASHYCTGQQVTISSGPLKGISGIVSPTGSKHFLMVESGINGIMLKIDMTKNVVE